MRVFNFRYFMFSKIFWHRANVVLFYHCRLVYKWFYNVHRVTYGLGVIGYMIIMSTFLGLNLMFMVSPDTAMGTGVTILFYGLYYGLLGRDCAEFCTDKMAAKMGVSWNLILVYRLISYFGPMTLWLFPFQVLFYGYSLLRRDRAKFCTDITAPKWGVN